MSSDQFLYNFAIDKIEHQQEYDVHRVTQTRLEDINRGNYPAGVITFDNTSLVGRTASSVIEISSGYIVLPSTTTITCDGTKIKFDRTKDYTLCGAYKSPLALIDSLELTMSGSSIVVKNNYNDMMATERMKTMNVDEGKLVNELMGFAWDSAQSVVFNSDVGDIANNVFEDSTGNVLQFANKGHIERMRMNNIDIHNIDDAGSDSHYSQIGDALGKKRTYLNEISQESVIASVTDTVITIKHITYIPLCKLHTVFQNMPSTQIAQGFKLKLMCNIGKENSYTVTYQAKNAANQEYPPLEVSAVQVNGSRCPFMLSPVVERVHSGIYCNGNDAGGGTITLKSIIGTADVNQVSIVFPSVEYAPETAKQILTADPYTVRYLDYAWEVDTFVRGGQRVKHQLGGQLSRVRQLYIMAFRKSPDQSAPALQSPLSSAGTTCSPIRLRNVSIRCGTEPIHHQPLTMFSDQFNDNVWSLLSRTNGNAFRSPEFSGQITRSMWSQGYSCFMYDLTRVSHDSAADNDSKQLSVDFEVMGDDTRVYDFYYFTTYEKAFQIERTSGAVVG